MSMGPMTPPNQPTSTNTNNVPNCAALHAQWREESAKTENLQNRLTTADILFEGAEITRRNCRDAMNQHNQILLGLAGQMNRIPGCEIPTN